jgi:hypothetical protein
MAFLCGVILCNYIPLSLAVALIGAPTPVQKSPSENPSALARLFLAGILAGMVAVGVYWITMFVRWFTDRQLARGQMAATLGGISLGSVLVAGSSHLLGCWDSVFLAAVVALLACGICAGPIIGIGQALHKRRCGKS